MHPQDSDRVDNIESDIMILIRDGHCPCLYIYELKQQQNVKLVCLSCAVCAVEEAARRALKIKISMIFSVDQQGMNYCDQFKLPEHNTVSNTTISKV